MGRCKDGAIVSLLTVSLYYREFADSVPVSRFKDFNYQEVSEGAFL